MLCGRVVLEGGEREVGARGGVGGVEFGSLAAVASLSPLNLACQRTQQNTVQRHFSLPNREQAWLLLPQMPETQ